MSFVINVRAGWLKFLFLFSGNFLDHHLSAYFIQIHSWCVGINWHTMLELPSIVNIILIVRKRVSSLKEVCSFFQFTMSELEDLWVVCSGFRLKAIGVSWHKCLEVGTLISDHTVNFGDAKQKKVSDWLISTEKTTTNFWTLLQITKCNQFLLNYKKY